MKIFAICVILACTVSVAEATAATDCDTCTSNFASSTACADITTYISCLIDTYETDKTLTGCSDITSKMDTANTAVTDNSCSVTDVCLCEVVYYQTATLDCDAIKAKLVCYFTKTDAGCDSAKTKIALVAEAKTIGGALSGCLTDTCLCESTYEATDVAAEGDKCTALKTEILCLESATGLACDGTKRSDEIATAVDLLIVDGSSVNCRADLTDSCACQITNAKTDISASGADCTASKVKLECLFAASAVGCDGSTTKIALVAAEKTTGKAIASCTLSIPANKPVLTTLVALITDTCECQAAYHETDVTAAEAKCTALKTEILCLESATGLACDGTKRSDEIATTVDVLIVDGGGVNCRTDLTDSCVCQITNAKTDTSASGADCTASKAKLECLFASTAVGCDGSTTKIALVAAEKTTGKAIASCITDSCECQAAYHETDVTAAAAKCTALKTELMCLDAATGLPCDSTVRIDEIATAVDALIVDGGGVNCRTDLTDSCLCQIAKVKTDTSASGAVCTAIKANLECLFAATAAGCDGTTTKTAIVGAEKTAGKLISSCITDTCECQATYHATDITAAAAKCTALKNEMNCLDAATGLACDGTKRSDEIATTMDALIVDGGGVNCLTDLTDTCVCQITYAKIDVSVAATKCTKLKEKLHCLIAADAVGCDGTSTRSAVATATDAKILDTVDSCRTGLTPTCTCGIAYAKTDTTLQAAKCLAATAAQTCLSAITTSATEFACDGTTLVETYLNSTITPLATLACDGTSLLLSTSVAMACLLVVFEMFH